MNWRSAAACAAADPALFVGPYGERDGARARRETAAKAVCASCPVTLRCLEFSFTVPVTGIFGGMDDAERAEEGRCRGVRPWCASGLHRVEPGAARCFGCKADSDRRRAEARKVREAA